MGDFKMKTVWMISVRSGHNRRDFEFTQHDDETPQDVYRRVKLNAIKLENQIKEKGKTSVSVDIISKTVAFKPKGVKPYRSWYWCPYCNKWRVFSYDENLDINRCSICGISDMDFYVRKYNHLFADGSRESIANIYKKVKK